MNASLEAFMCSGWKQETGNRKQETGNQQTGNRKPADRKQETTRGEQHVSVVVVVWGGGPIRPIRFQLLDLHEEQSDEDEEQRDIARLPGPRSDETLSLGPDLFPGLHVFASGLQELLVGQVEGLADGERDLLRLRPQTRCVID
ncbi:hypothetical protein EYF80_036309 [Liparis tanakae]|uniref:Uncharacterized protein n=1 Tax=Liparis tanakae TaxID=230148 RepID=A0A4Z2GIZ5_9TELE|nr:hypothetical protein EYF80_036309 [Liparis tanakae]